MTGYTSETKQREEAAGVLSSGAVGCTLLVLSAVCYAYAFPTVGENVIDGAASLMDEMQGLKQENALLKAHLRRLAESQKQLFAEDSPVTDKTGARSEARASMRRLLMDTESLLQRQDEEDASEGGLLQPEPAEEEASDLHVAGRTFQSVSSQQAEAPKVGQRAMSDAAQPEEGAREGGNAVMQAVIDLWSVCQGMYTGVKAVSYNAYQAIVIGRTRADGYVPHRQRKHRKPGTGTGWRKKEKKEVQKAIRKRKTARSARNGRHSRRKVRRI